MAQTLMAHLPCLTRTRSHYVASDLGLHCLQMTLLQVSHQEWVIVIIWMLLLTNTVKEQTEICVTVALNLLYFKRISVILECVEHFD